MVVGIGWLLINIAILIGIYVLCIVAGFLVGFMYDEMELLFIGHIVGCILSVILVVVSLIVWGVVLIGANV